MTLDDYVPAPHFRERHSRRVAASPAAAWDALLELRLSDVPLTRGMMALGALPARLSGREPVHLRPGAGIIGAVPVPVLASVPQRWLVAAGVGRPWRLRSGVQPASPPRRAEELRGFDEPGWVTLAIESRFGRWEARRSCGPRRGCGRRTLAPEPSSPPTSSWCAPALG